MWFKHVKERLHLYFNAPQAFSPENQRRETSEAGENKDILHNTAAVFHWRLQGLKCPPRDSVAYPGFFFFSGGVQQIQRTGTWGCTP